MNETLTAETLRAWGRQFSNWGRWGDDDELGTLHFLTRDRVLAAAGLVRTGQVVSCAWPFEAKARAGPPHGTVHDVGVAPGDPAGAGGARWEPPGGVSYDGCRYNGRPADGAPAGAASLDRVADGVVGRGVLLDLPGRLGLPWLDDGTRILPEDLDACAESSGVAIETGDVLLIRTGRLARAFFEGSYVGYADGPSPGLSLRCIRWLHERRVAAVATDTACVEVLPPEVDGPALPFHRVAVRDLGLLLGERFHLDRLAEACAQDGRYAFLFAAPALPGPGALSAPINPLAVK